MEQKEAAERGMTAAEAAEALEQLRKDYLAAYEAAAAKRRPAGRSLLRWVTGHDPLAEDPMHVAFYENAEKAVERLCAALAGTAETEPAEAEAVASAAAARLLSERSGDDHNSTDWWLVAIQPLCAGLLPYLSPASLQALRAQYLAHTPKRLMFPKQRELLSEMDRLLKR